MTETPSPPPATPPPTPPSADQPAAAPPAPASGSDVAATGSDPRDVLGKRVVAALIDLALLIALFVVMGILFGDSKAEDGNASVNLSGLPALAFFVLTFLYYFLLESRGGQTLGKRVMGVRVVSESGGQPTGGKVAIRTLLRIVDGFAFYLVGLLVAMTSGRKAQRLGDKAANTLVVRA